MKARALLILGLILIVVNPLVFGQAEYLSRGQHGLEIGFGYTSVEDIRGYGLVWGYTPNGIFDLSFSASTASPSGSDDRLTVFSAGFTYYLLDASREFVPITPVLKLGVSHYSYAPTRSDKTLVFEPGLGAGLFVRMKPSELTQVHLSLTVLYENNNSAASFSLPLFFASRRGWAIKAEPGVVWAHGQSAIGVTLAWASTAAASKSGVDVW